MTADSARRRPARADHHRPRADATPRAAARPLDGVRVLDLSRFIAGPLCSQILADMGAEVIKVERPGGEDARAQGPTFNGESLYTMAYNRNKLGVTLDTRHEAAGPVLRALVARADVLVENYRPGTLEAMGLGPDARALLNPRLIVTSLSGFGQTGPFADRTLFDPIAQAMSGLMSLTGEPDGPPTLGGTYLADHVAALYGAIGTLLALRVRDRDGFGQVVDVASLDALFSTLGTRPAAAAMLGEAPARNGSRDAFAAPANRFQAADGDVYIHGGTDPIFRRLSSAIGCPELADDPRYATVPLRLAAADELERIIDGWTRERSVADIGCVLTAAGVPFGPVAAVADAVGSEQLLARDMVVTIDHPKVGPLVLTGIPVKLAATPGSIRTPPPTVGEHNAEVYGGLLGMDEQEIERLRAAGAI